MSRATRILVSVAILAAVWVAASAQVQPVPGPGTGVVTVTGDVSVANRPTVMARQQGDWSVSIANTAPVTVTNTPAVTVALPLTVRKGSRYEIAWPTGERETIVAAQDGTGAWVRVEGGAGAGERWINLSAARALTEIR